MTLRSQRYDIMTSERYAVINQRYDVTKSDMTSLSQRYDAMKSKIRRYEVRDI